MISRCVFLLLVASVPALMSTVLIATLVIAILVVDIFFRGGSSTHANVEVFINRCIECVYNSGRSIGGGGYG